jgi:L-alanine-DL-glutamate epimerase-like enolase superfamily enzyme
VTARRPAAAIDRVDASVYTVPTDLPEADGTLSWDSTTVVVVEVSAGGGRGLGWSYASAAAAAVVRELLEPAVRGRSALDTTAANEAMIRAVRNAGRSGIAATAISAVDIAIWDLKAKLLGLSVAQLLGPVHQSVPIYGSGGFTTYDADQTARQVEDWLSTAGVGAVKIKVGESWGACEGRDLERTAVVRRLIGDRALFVDANGGYSVAQAVRMGAQYDDLGVTWFEEPVSSDDLAGLRAVRAAVRADVAAGEYGFDPFHFRGLLEAEAVDCLQVDATRCGGVTGFLGAAAVAAAYGREVSAHCAPHLHAQVAASVPNIRHIEYFHDHVRIEQELLFEGATQPRLGALAANLDRPGHGMSLRPDAGRWLVSS